VVVLESLRLTSITDIERRVSSVGLRMRVHPPFELDESRKVNVSKVC